MIIANGTLTHQLTKNITFLVSANEQQRDRFTDKYIRIDTLGGYVDALTLFSLRLPTQQAAALANQYFPKPNRAMSKTGVNGKLIFHPKENKEVDLSFGAQESDVQKIFAPDNSSQVFKASTFLSHSITRSQYINVKTVLNNFNLRGGLLKAFDSFIGESYNYDYEDLVAEYNIKKGSKITITPGVGYSRVAYNQIAGFNLLDGSPSIETWSGTLRSDLALNKNWRVVLGIRGDKFSTHHNWKGAYELASTYQLNDKNLIRAVLTQSNTSSFVGPSYAKANLGQATVLGKLDLNLPTVRLIELGYRSRLSNKMQIDVDIFYQHQSNPFYYVTAISPSGIVQQMQSFPTTGDQIGTSISMTFVPTENLTIKPFITLQKTTIENLPNGFTSFNGFPGGDIPITYSNGVVHKNTPPTYGGYYVQYQPCERLGINFNGYFLAAQTQYDASDFKTFLSSEGQISGKLIFSTKLTYQLAKGLSVFGNARNLFNSHSREFYGADITGGSYLIGAMWKLN